jgi:glutamate racemase
MVRICLLVYIALFAACQKQNHDSKVVSDRLPQKNERVPIVQQILHMPESFFYLNLKERAIQDSSKLPIGVFDSGTGGLAVMEAIFTLDEFNNKTRMPGADGTPDFNEEHFIYLADQANMPYGLYARENNTPLLQEHILKNLWFLLSDRYWCSPGEVKPKGRKKPVKSVVIACNTATAYGKRSLVTFCDSAKIRLPIIGVIDAGALGALNHIGLNASGTIGVLATPGTVASKGYPKAIRQWIKRKNGKGKIDIVQQGGLGLAEAIDRKIDFINPQSNKPRAEYKGPALDGPENFKIKPSLFPAYNFDFKNNQILCDSIDGNCQEFQINSTNNYIRYHLVSILETLRQKKSAQPLKALILGCTHYPYVKDEIRMALNKLYNFKEKGQYPYRELISKDLALIDPARYTAMELYKTLSDQQLLRKKKATLPYQFFISIPHINTDKSNCDPNGDFRYNYKYDRATKQTNPYCQRVPFSTERVGKERMLELQTTIPVTYNKMFLYMQAISKKCH